MSVSAVGYARLIEEAPNQDYKIELAGFVTGGGLASPTQITYSKIIEDAGWDRGEGDNAHILSFDKTPFTISIDDDDWVFDRFRIQVDVSETSTPDFQTVFGSTEVPDLGTVSDGDTVTITNLQAVMKTINPLQV